MLSILPRSLQPFTALSHVLGRDDAAQRLRATIRRYWIGAFSPHRPSHFAALGMPLGRRASGLT